MDDDEVLCIVGEGPLSVKGERQYIFRYADGVKSTHRELTKRFTSQINGKEVQRTPEEVAEVKKAIAAWKIRYPNDCPEVQAKFAEHATRSCFWVRCCECGKNRKMPVGIKKSFIGNTKTWTCRMNTDLERDTCEAEEQPEDQRVCQHKDHEEWHPTVPRKQPLSAFYGRLRVCALCHKMRSKNSSRRNRAMSVPSTALIMKNKRSRRKARSSSKSTESKRRKKAYLEEPVFDAADSAGLDALFSVLKDEIAGL